MGFSKEWMLGAVRRQLAVDMNCSEADFLAEGTVFTRAARNPGRRIFDRPERCAEAATMGRGIVVTADPVTLGEIRPALEGKARDDLFFAPFFYGHSLYYLPERVEPLPCPAGYTLRVFEREECFELYELPGFRNALQYDRNHPRPDVLAVAALKGGVPVGVAGDSADCGMLWQIGIDVRPEHRGAGLAACLVSRLALLTLERGFIPYYGTASSNIASQMVAHRSGFMPAWMCTHTAGR